MTFADFYSKFGIFIILLIAVIASSLLSSTFLQPQNLINILRQNTVVIILAFGAQMVLISGEVDLSAGSVAAFAGCMACIVQVATENIFLSVLAALVCGAIFGFLNGFVVTYCGIPSFIMTLATQFIGRGAIQAITNAQPIRGLGDTFTQIGQGYVGPVPIPIIIVVIVLAVYWIIINRRRFGRFLFAVGGNADAAKASGISVHSVKIKAFAFAGLMSGLGGLILMSRLASGQPNGAEAYEFDAITATIIGGTSMSGGIGKVSGTVAGAIFVGILLNILTLLSVSSYYQKIVKGVIIALAVIIDVRVRRAKRT
ncbi:MAG: ABC transporter permease [Fastidiosipilaceae bacterium]|jgi:inositol transport system permease protein